MKCGNTTQTKEGKRVSLVILVWGKIVGKIVGQTSCQYRHWHTVDHLTKASSQTLSSIFKRRIHTVELGSKKETCSSRDGSWTGLVYVTSIKATTKVLFRSSSFDCFEEIKSTTFRSENCLLTFVKDSVVPLPENFLTEKIALTAVLNAWDIFNFFDCHWKRFLFFGIFAIFCITCINSVNYSNFNDLLYFFVWFYQKNLNEQSTFVTYVCVLQTNLSLTCSIKYTCSKSSLDYNLYKIQDLNVFCGAFPPDNGKHTLP